MATVTLRLPPGLERQASPYDTVDRWWDMNLVRWQGGQLLPVGGNQRVTGTPLDSAIRKLHVWRNNATNRVLLAGTDAKLYVDQSPFVDITPYAFVGPGTVSAGGGGFGTFDFGAETFGTARSAPSPIYTPYGYWSMDEWGEDIVLTANTDGRIFYYDQTTPTTAPVVQTGAPVSNRAVLVTAERHVMAIGADGDPRKIAWSSSEDPSDWDFASVTNTAGFLNLRTSTPLLRGWHVKEGILVNSYTECFLVEFTGLPFIYGGQDPISNTSMFHPDSVATFNGKAMWPSRIGFQQYAGGFVTDVPCPFFADFLLDMDPVWGPFRIHGSFNGVFNEVWWFYPSVGQTECNRYVVYNVAEGWWGWGAMSRSAMFPAGAYQRPYMGSPEGHVFEHEYGWLDAGMSRVGNVWVESGALSIGDGSRTADLSQLRLATGSGYDTITVRAFGKYTPEGTEYPAGPWAARSNGYTDARTSFMDTRLRFELAKDGPFSLGLVRMDVTPALDARQRNQTVIVSLPSPPPGSLGQYLGRVLDTIRRAFGRVVATDEAAPGIILQSPNGTAYTVTVDDAGALQVALSGKTRPGT
jgi:hypothetical protein